MYKNVRITSLKLPGVLKSSISWKIRTFPIPQAVFFFFFFFLWGSAARFSGSMRRSVGSISRNASSLQQTTVDPVKLENKTSLKFHISKTYCSFCARMLRKLTIEHILHKKSASTPFSTIFWHLDKQGKAARLSISKH